ncbi:hypothetical protein BDN70DRAFT_871989 [Pholiota conissans]|uniref:Uncharacterized protein n=1 Tax=Pholiota conissans TaxID=109636 RepID=A0A9P6D5X4_9AGAR|nr:hypothetical protein BDN70DRAFT_871989 [Pholiota conissans]
MIQPSQISNSSVDACPFPIAFSEIPSGCVTNCSPTPLTTVYPRTAFSTLTLPCCRAVHRQSQSQQSSPLWRDKNRGQAASEFSQEPTHIVDAEPSKYIAKCKQYLRRNDAELGLSLSHRNPFLSREDFVSYFFASADEKNVENLIQRFAMAIDISGSHSTGNLIPKATMYIADRPSVAIPSKDMKLCN